MEGSYLSDLVRIEDIRFDEGIINLIEAPCGAGKTTLAIEKLIPELSSEKRSLYLIDTVAGRDQLAQREDCQVYDPDWRYHMAQNNLYWYCHDKVNIMTYAKFGELCLHCPDWYEGLDVIICDEVHSFIEMIGWELNSKRPNKSKTYQAAWRHLLNGVMEEKISAVIAMTATPDRLYHFVDAVWDSQEQQYFSPLINPVPLHGTPRCYVPEDTESYRNLKMLCERLPMDEKGIVYIQRIEMMLQYMEILKSRGLRTEGIWSLNNTDYPMDKVQKAVREHIIKHQAIPEDIDVLFINKSCETSINIKSRVDYMVVHCSDHDVVTQAMGRYRGNLKTLYRYDSTMKDEFVIPEELLEKPLYKEDLDAYITKNNIRDNHGRIMGHSTFLEYILTCGYEVEKKKHKGGKRYTVLHAA